MTHNPRINGYVVTCSCGKFRASGHDKLGPLLDWADHKRTAETNLVAAGRVAN